MDFLTPVLALLATLSLATERITEMIKNVPLWSAFLCKEQPDDRRESLRRLLVQGIAVTVGAVLTSQIPQAVQKAFGIEPNWLLCLVVGAFASGGSGLWNGLLDISREIKKLKEQQTVLVRTEVKQAQASLSPRPQ